MAYQLTKGVQYGAPKKICVYGPEGIGKTTFAAELLKLRNGRMIDTEGGSGLVDVVRYPVPATWGDLLAMVRDAAASDCGAVAIDTVDAAERLCAAQLIQANGWKSLEDPGYGSGYKRLWEAFSDLMKRLDECIAAGKDVILIAHAAMRKFEQPDQMGSYDRWELKLQSSQKCSITALVKEWCDLLLFANYETTVVTSSDGKTRKAAGGKRVMYTSHHPCWDAKNRFGMPDSLPFAFDEIASLFTAAGAPAEAASPAPEKPVTVTSAPLERAITSAPQRKGRKKAEDPEPAVSKPATVAENAPVAAAEPAPDPVREAPAEPEKDVYPALTEKDVAGLPDKLVALMMKDNIHPIELVTWTEHEGYFNNMQLTEYDPDYLAQYLPSVWEKRIVPETRRLRETLPF